jgi:hypothetical protein
MLRSSRPMVDDTDRVAMLSDLAGLDARLDSRMNDFLAEVRILIAEEGVTTRRHFDIMVERMAELMKPLADGVAHHSTVLDDHESRLKQLEK